ncbi:MAG: cupin domain-containing protein [Opitutaceae bacterium]|nr:cupin domain-containing protein [Opitutaceae bacterium]
MICRHAAFGSKLDVSGLNEITVLIDRSETERTEVALNTWQPGIDGPPHKHERKEQSFLVLSGHGEVIVGGRTFPAGPGTLFFLPADVVHQTIARGDTPLQYFLFNAFLDSDKEGHASFAAHIDAVKHIRRQQADERRADVSSSVAQPPETAGGMCGLSIPLPDSLTGSVVLLAASPSKRCEIILHAVPAGGGSVIASHSAKEQTLYVLSGSGRVEIGGECAEVGEGHTLFQPRHVTANLVAGQDGMRVVAFGTFVC